MNKILVVGAGMFGLDLAVALAKVGFQVTVMEKNDAILSGTTRNSLLRIHSGLHYPRDIETAKQSARGLNLFKRHYNDQIFDNFSNYYAIAKVNSKIKSRDFEIFADSLGIPYDRCESDFEFKRDIDMDKISSIYKVNEGVLDLDKMTMYFLGKFLGLGVNLLTSTEVIGISKLKNNWVVDFKNKSTHGDFSEKDNTLKEEYQFIVDATHSFNSYFSTSNNSNKMEYQITFMINMKYKADIVGLTILDGDFLTIQPMVENNQILATVYSPMPSVRARSTGFNIPSKWYESSKLGDYFSEEQAQCEILERLNHWAPGLLLTGLVSSKTGVRVIEANVTESDRRRSAVLNIAPNFYSIVSTKLDHCIEITDNILRQIISSIEQ
jgi:hypothetical protein